MQSAYCGPVTLLELQQGSFGFFDALACIGGRMHDSHDKVRMHPLV
jgi:hypothetical protein